MQYCVLSEAAIKNFDSLWFDPTGGSNPRSTAFDASQHTSDVVLTRKCHNDDIVCTVESRYLEFR